MNKLGIVLSLLLFFGCGENKTDRDSQPSAGLTITPERELSFIDTDGNIITTIQVEVADDDAERSQGLMDVRSMPSDEGMIFIFDNESPRSFWMVNTPLSLDIMYVSSDSTIVRIYRNTTPYSDATLPSDYPAQFVVETNAGFSLANGISEGTRIRF